MKYPNIVVLYVSFVLLMTLPALLLATLSAPRFSLALIPVGMILLYSSARLAKISASETQQIVTSTFWLFVYLFTGLSPFLQIAANNFPWPGTYDDVLLFKTAIIILTGLLAFNGGHYFFRYAKRVVVPKTLQRPLNKISVIFLCGISPIFAIYALQRLGGFEIFFVPRLERSQLLPSDLDLPEMFLLTNLAATPAH